MTEDEFYDEDGRTECSTETLEVLNDLGVKYWRVAGPKFGHHTQTSDIYLPCENLNLIAENIILRVLSKDCQ